jgi:hypothetical protein
MNPREWPGRARRILRHTPIVGRTLDCNPEEHWQTLRELIAGLFWSMLPIWVGTFATFVKGNAFDWAHFHAAFNGTVEGGELFIYAAAFLAPVFWFLHHHPPGAGEFPSSLAHAILTAIITVFAALSFEMQRSGQISDPRVIHRLAVWFFWAALLLIYLATLYHNHRLPGRLPDALRKGQDQFVEHYREHRP